MPSEYTIYLNNIHSVVDVKARLINFASIEVQENNLVAPGVSEILVIEASSLAKKIIKSNYGFVPSIAIILYLKKNELEEIVDESITIIIHEICLKFNQDMVIEYNTEKFLFSRINKIIVFSDEIDFWTDKRREYF